MGGGASKKNAAQERQKKAKQKGGASSSEAAGQGDGAENAEEERLLKDPSIKRRREVLFGGGNAIRSFERTSPQDQFKELPEADDVVYRRCGQEAFNLFRNQVEEVRFSDKHDRGFLEENAIQLLQLDLPGDSRLARRLFDVAQVQMVSDPAPRPEKLTCYELLSLFSVIRYGERSELLELLFCVSDVDGDDRVSVNDLKMFIAAFLRMEEAGTDMDADELQGFRRLDDKEIDKEAESIAKKAIKEFGSVALNEDEDSDAPPTPALDKSTDQDMKSEDSDPSVSSKKAHANPDTGKKPARGGLCKGAPPADSDGSSAEGERGRSREKKADAAKTSARQKKKKSGGGCFGGGGKNKGPPALNYEQWQQWLQHSELLPQEWADALQESLEQGPRDPALGEPVEAVVVQNSEVVGSPISDHAGSDTEGGDDSPPARRGWAAGPPPTETQPFITTR